uniref:NADP-dependent oxidoreductase domain-containing protein n=1 Tax=Ditylum brightwellii TaxID=49249 RepID=A0A6V2PCI4_9STRA|mmetsp:Transcript_1653/g.2267  ORF Transcript_1653/g.2267 Transcript_1653/m.2267 type:complete len:449 (+) Transcript_1653:183-1529(+)
MTKTGPPLILTLTLPAIVTSFGVIPTETPRSMDSLVMGTVALPNVPSGDPFQLLTDAYDRGFRRFDLARTYGMGKSEDIFGRWMQECNIDRETIGVVTKGGMGNDKYGDPSKCHFVAFPSWLGLSLLSLWEVLRGSQISFFPPFLLFSYVVYADRPMCTSESLRSELTASLESLRTDYADLYMLHRDDLRIDVREFVDWMNDLKRDNLINEWGVSNWSARRVEEAYDYALKNGLAPPTATSPQLSLAVPLVEVWPSTESLSCPSKDIDLDWYKEHGIEVMGWESLAKGFMAVPTLWRSHELPHYVMHGPDPEIGTDAWRLSRIQRAYCTPQNYQRRSIANKIAKDSGMTLAQVSLLYLLTKCDNISVLVGADRTSHLDEMAELQNWALDEEALHCLTAASMKSLEEDRAKQQQDFQMPASIEEMRKKVTVSPKVANIVEEKETAFASS